MANYQNALEYVKDQMQRGLMTASESNVKMVQMMGIKIVNGKLHSEVRKALNEAVKIGELGKVKKDGLKPEIYHHKNARARALTEQDRIEREAKSLLNKHFA